MSRFHPMLWQSFTNQRDTYILLRNKLDATQAEISKTIERLVLVRAFLALNVENLTLPSELQKRDSGRRNTA
jgi:hypothetical protein